MFLEAVDAISHMPEARGRARLVLGRVPTKMQDSEAGRAHTDVAKKT